MITPSVAMALMLATPAESTADIAATSGPDTMLVAPTAENSAVPSDPVAPPPPSSQGQDDADDDHGPELVVTGRAGAPRGDPLESVNIQSYEVTQAIDVAFVRPVAKTYQRVLPRPLRAGIRNFINNLREPVAFLNFLLQHKPGKAAETFGRFALNSTFGVAGLVDVAKTRPFNLPRRANGLANTLGFYGVKPGPFLFVPLVGPTTLRDVIGDGLDRLILPGVVGKPFNQPPVAIGLYLASTLDQRAEFDEKLEAQHKSEDPYARTREDYLKARQDAIDELRGKRKDKPKSDAEIEAQPAD